ncbi:thiolase C-terminal domain-containing protein [Pseudomonas aeruginosa]
MPDLTVTAAAGRLRGQAEMAGVRHADIDLVMTTTPLPQHPGFSGFGFCAKGEGGPFVQGGRIAPGGELAVNTNGERACPACIRDVRDVPDHRGGDQLRRQAGERQLAKADVAVACTATAARCPAR